MVARPVILVVRQHITLTRNIPVTPIERTLDWLRNTLAEMPSQIRMVYIDSGEHVTPAPESRTVARYDLFGFHSIPVDGFDPESDETEVVSQRTWLVTMNARESLEELPKSSSG